MAENPSAERLGVAFRPSPPALFLFAELVRRDFQQRYAGSLLGFFWSFILPLWQLFLFTFVFAVVLRVRLEDIEGMPTERFAVFLFAGLLPWLGFQEGVVRGAAAVTEHGHLVKKARFPAATLVAAAASAPLIHQLIATAVFLAVLAALGEAAWSRLPLLAIALPLQLGLALGIGLGLASVQVFVRDVAQLLGLLMMGWFFLTPIVYPLEMVPAGYRAFIGLNPLTWMVDLYRQALLGGEAGWLAPAGLLAATAGLALALGWALFRRLAPAFPDEL